MRYLAILLCLFALPAAADNVTLTWQWPDSYCPAAGQTVGDAFDVADIQAAEIYISETPIPRVPGSCGPESDVPPSGAVIAQVNTPDTEVTVDLTCGATYHFVIRVQATNNEWSNFSAEAQRTIDCGRPEVPIIISLS